MKRFAIALALMLAVMPVVADKQVQTAGFVEDIIEGRLSFPWCTYGGLKDLVFERGDPWCGEDCPFGYVYIETLDDGLILREGITIGGNVVASGDVDGDGIGDIVVVVSHNGGGSAIFKHLVAIALIEGSVEILGIWDVGSRTLVNKLEIIDGSIFADLVVHGRSDPHCCPSISEVREFTMHETDMEYHSCFDTTGGNE